jgi:hypothetical protein
MSADGKLVLEADVSAILRADKQVQASQAATEKGYAEVQRASEKASDAAIAGARAEAKAIEQTAGAARSAVNVRQAALDRQLARAEKDFNRKLLNRDVASGVARYTAGNQDARSAARSERARELWSQRPEVNRQRTLQKAERDGQAMLAQFEREWKASQPIKAHQDKLWRRDMASGVSPYDVTDPNGRSSARSARAKQLWAGRGQRRSEAAAAEAKAAEDAAFADHLDTAHKRRRWQRESAVRQARAGRAATMEAEEAQQRAVGERLTAHTARQGRAGQFLRQGIGEGARAAMAFGAGVVGVNMLSELGDRKTALGDEAISNDRLFAPLMGVGDNATRRAEVRSEVFRMSGGMGIDAGQVAAGRFSIESAASNLGPDVRTQLLQSAAQFNKFQGTDLQIAGKALNKYVQIFGNDLQGGAKGVRQASNKLAYAADVGDFEVEDAARYLPDLLGSFQAMGLSGDDALSSLIVGSQKGGRMETIFTGLRNVALRKGEAEEKTGVKLSEDLPTMLAQIATWKGPEMLEVFGAEAIATAQNLADGADAVRQYRQELRGITGDVDAVGQKLKAAWADTAHATAELLGSLREDAKNREANKAGSPEMAPKLTLNALADKAVEENADPLTPRPIKYARKLLAEYTSFMGEEKAGAFNDTVKKLRDAGNHVGADYLTLQQGAISGHRRRKTETRRGFMGFGQVTGEYDVTTGQLEAEAFGEMAAKHDNWTLKDDDTYWRYKNSGQHGKAFQFQLGRRNAATVASEGVAAIRGGAAGTAWDATFGRVGGLGSATGLSGFAVPSSEDIGGGIKGAAGWLGRMFQQGEANRIEAEKAVRTAQNDFNSKTRLYSRESNRDLNRDGTVDDAEKSAVAKELSDAAAKLKAASENLLKYQPPDRTVSR